MNTIEGCSVFGSWSKSKSATSGVTSTLLWLGNGSPIGGAVHSHLGLGANSPAICNVWHDGSNAPRGPRPYGMHSPWLQYESSSQVASVAQAAGGSMQVS